MRTLALFLLLSGVAMAQLPDAPVPQRTQLDRCDSTWVVPQLEPHVWQRPPDHFFTFRSDSDAPALRPDRKSWAVFVLSHAAGWGALIAAGRNHRSGENWSQEAPALAAVTVVDYALFKLLSPSMGVEGGIYAGIHYSHSATK